MKFKVDIRIYIKASVIARLILFMEQAQSVALRHLLR